MYIYIYIYYMLYIYIYIFVLFLSLGVFFISSSVGLGIRDQGLRAWFRRLGALRFRVALGRPSGLAKPWQPKP